MPKFPPAIPLHGGPYAGKDAAALSSKAYTSYGVLFFPDRLHVVGPDGSAVYVLEDGEKGKVGKFSHNG